MDNLAGVSAFVQAAETLSFVDAGRVLGISASAVGKSIARLENRLGVRLFHRSTRSMTLTAEGRRFLLRCQRILEEMAAAERLIVLQDGRVAADGPPAELLRDEALLREQCLETLYALALCRELRSLGWPIEESMTEEEAVNAIWTYYSNMSRTDTRMEQAL